jgi:hypothetical protein
VCGGAVDLPVEVALKAGAPLLVSPDVSSNPGLPQGRRAGESGRWRGLDH